MLSARQTVNAIKRFKESLQCCVAIIIKSCTQLTNLIIKTTLWTKLYLIFISMSSLFNRQKKERKKQTKLKEIHATMNSNIHDWWRENGENWENLLLCILNAISTKLPGYSDVFFFFLFILLFIIIITPIVINQCMWTVFKWISSVDYFEELTFNECGTALLTKHYRTTLWKLCLGFDFFKWPPQWASNTKLRNHCWFPRLKAFFFFNFYLNDSCIENNYIIS